MEFYLRVNALLRPDMTVLDYGAGRGAQLNDDPVQFRRELATLRGKVQRLVGIDVDPAVLENSHLDEAHVVGLGERLPFPDGTFDLIVADWVLEHVANPEVLASEVSRLLKPGGWFCARTPNRYGITGLGARLIPNRFHVAVLKILQPKRKEVDTFPVTYRINTRRAVRRYFSSRDWQDSTYLSNGEPLFVLRWPLLMGLTFLYWRLTPRFLATDLYIFMQRR